MAASQNTGSAGLAPQMSIVNADGTPTVFFFRWLLNTAATAAAGGNGGGNAPGDDTQVVFNAGGSLSSDPTFTFHDGSLWLSGPAGTGVAAPLFNSTAEGVDHAFQQKDGRFYVTGAGDGYFQNLIVTNTFNSEATGATAAVQQYTGTFVIFGNGNAQFQALAIAGPLTFPDGTVQVTAAAGGGGGGGGSVTSVALSMPPEFTVTGSPVTGAGTLTAAKVSQAANLVYAAPSGAAGVPAFRALAAADFSAGVVGGFQTPWLQNISAAGHSLSNLDFIQFAGSGSSAILAPLTPIGLATGGASKVRLIVDTAGHVTINKPDDASAALTFAGGVSTITSPAGNLGLVATSILYLQGSGASGQVQVLTGAAGASRVVIDNVGNVTFLGTDAGAGAKLLLNGGVSNITATAGNLGITGTPFLILQGAGASGQVQLLTGAGSAVRLGIDSAGHVSIAQPDDGQYGQALYAAGYGRFGAVETAGLAGLDVNVYFNGSAWTYRADGPGLMLTANAGGGFGALFMASIGTAGTTASLGRMLTFYGTNFLTVASQPFAQALPAPATSALEANMPNSSAMLTLTSNTQLTFRVRGSDGVMRQGSVTLA